jgi:hypothetical protein
MSTPEQSHASFFQRFLYLIGWKEDPRHPATRIFDFRSPGGIVVFIVAVVFFVALAKVWWT